MKSQLWIAVSVYVLVAIMKKQLRLQESLYTILQILSVNVFGRSTIYQLITGHDDRKTPGPTYNQLKLFE